MTAISLPRPDVDVPPAGLTIGEVARQSGLSVETLRYYEREGLMLGPAQRDPSGRRRYGAEDLAWIGGLLMLRDTGMSVADMRALAELSRVSGTEAARLEVLDAHRRRILDDLARTQRHLAALEKKIAAYRAVLDHTTSENGRTTG